MVVSSVQVPIELSAATAPAASFMLTPSGSMRKMHNTSVSLGLYFRSTKSMYRITFQASSSRLFDSGCLKVLIPTLPISERCEIE